MELAHSIREDLVEELDAFLENFDDNPDPEAVAGYVMELLEQYAEEHAIDDIFTRLEESGALEASFSEAMESEMDSNDEFTYTGEEVVSLLERLCGVEWNDDLDLLDDDEDDEEDDFSEEV